MRHCTSIYKHNVSYFSTYLVDTHNAVSGLLAWGDTIWQHTFSSYWLLNYSTMFSWLNWMLFFGKTRKNPNMLSKFGETGLKKWPQMTSYLAQTRPHCCHQLIYAGMAIQHKIGTPKRYLQGSARGWRSRLAIRRLELGIHSYNSCLFWTNHSYNSDRMSVDQTWVLQWLR